MRRFRVWAMLAVAVIGLLAWERGNWTSAQAQSAGPEPLLAQLNAGGNAAGNAAAGENAAGGEPTAGPPQPPASPGALLVGLGGINVSTRNSKENDFSEDTKKWGVEVLRDHYGGSSVYMTETGDIAAATTFPSFAFHSIKLAPEAAPEIMRLNAQTGETWHLIGGETWQKLPEVGTIPSTGNYDLLLSASGDTSFFAYRIDRVTGRSWRLGGGSWSDINEPQ